MNRKIRKKRRFYLKKSKRRSYSKIGEKKSKRRSYSKIGRKKSKRKPYSKIGGKKSKRRSYSKIMNKVSNGLAYKRNKYGGGNLEILKGVYRDFEIPEDKHDIFTVIFVAYKEILSLLDWDIGKKYINTSGSTPAEIEACTSKPIDKCSDDAKCGVYESSRKTTAKPKPTKVCWPINTIKDYNVGQSIQVSSINDGSKAELTVEKIWDTTPRKTILFNYQTKSVNIILFPFGAPIIPTIPADVTLKINELISENKRIFLCGHSMGTGMIQQICTENIAEWSRYPDLYIIMTGPLIYKGLAPDFNEKYKGKIITFNFGLINDLGVIEYDYYASMVMGSDWVDFEPENAKSLNDLKSDGSFKPLKVLSVIPTGDTYLLHDYYSKNNNYNSLTTLVLTELKTVAPHSASLLRKYV